MESTEVSTEITINNVVVSDPEPQAVYNEYTVYIFFILVAVLIILGVHSIFKKIRGVE